MVLAHVLRKHPREISVGPWMVGGQQEDTFWRIALLVRPETDPRKSNLTADVVLTHQEIGNADSASVLDDQIDGGILGRHAPLLRNGGKRLTRKWLQLRVLERQ